MSVFKIKLDLDKPHLVCICESWLKPNREPSFNNYNSVFKHRPNQLGGGLAFLVRKDVNFVTKPITSFPNRKLECQAITIVSGNDKIDIINLYNPVENISSQEFSYRVPTGQEKSGFWIPSQDF